ncbi:MAG TPA: prenyltransferase/squalene oxidase repeat-containing protein [Gaiellaceae bacterium]|nr:prenyltransferase/squalene oxidase repeat-containing protein [Gaiellaceae bacterium]
MRLPALAAAAVVATTPVAYLQGRQEDGGGFAEPRGKPSPQLTAWAVLGLRAAGARISPAALDYLVAHEDGLPDVTNAELLAMAETVLGRRPDRLLARIEAARRADGRIGPNVNSTIWGVLALRQAGRPAPRASVRFILRRQARSGGWSWLAGGAPDSNDTAAAVEALRAAGVRGAPIRRGLRYLRRLQNRDGGFELIPNRGSDSQTTAWAIQAFVAAGARVPAKATSYLRRMRRADGSFRYSTRYAATPVWVTAQVLPALARRPFPLQLEHP